MKRTVVLVVLLALALLNQAWWFYGKLFLSVSTVSDVYGFRLATDDPLRVKSLRVLERNGMHPLAHQAGLKKEDRILSITHSNGQGGEIRHQRDLWDAYKTIRGGRNWRLQVQRPGARDPIWIDLPPLRAHETPLIRRLIEGTLIGTIMLITLFTGFFVGFSKPNDDHAFTCSLLFISISTVFGLPYETTPAVVREVLLLYNSTLNAFLIYFFLRFFLYFPSRSWIDRSIPWLKRAAFWIVALGWLLTIAERSVTWLSFAVHYRWIWLWGTRSKLLGYFILLFFLLGLISLILNTVMSQSRSEKRRMAIILFGTFFGLTPLLVLALLRDIFQVTPPMWTAFLALIAMALFPSAFIYSVLRHRVMGIRFIIRRGIQYALVSQGFLVVEGLVLFAAFVAFIGPAFREFTNQAGVAAFQVFSLLSAFAVILGVRGVNRRIMPAIDRRFFRDAYSAQQILIEMSRTVQTMATNPAQLVDAVMRTISNALYPTQISFFVRFDWLLSMQSFFRHETVEASAARPASEDFVGLQRLVTRSRHDLGWSSPKADDMMLLPAKGLVASHFERTHSDASAPLDVSAGVLGARRKPASDSDEVRKDIENELGLLQKIDPRLIVPLSTPEQAIGFLIMSEKLSEEPYSGEDKKLLKALADQVALALSYSRLINEVAEQEKLKRELEIAQEVQAQLFPRHLPALKTLDYVGKCRAARGVGGDYYDFIPLRDGRLALALGDIAGKGISAALLMAGLQAMLRSCVSSHAHDIRGLMTEINRRMSSSTAAGRYATVFYGVYDDTKRELSYVNAGHNPPFVLRRCPSSQPAQAPVRRFPMATAATTEFFPPYEDSFRLTTGGLAVGLFEDAFYESETVKLQPGDILLIYSDGITEAVDSAGNEFGEQRLCSIVRDNSSLSAQELCNIIFRLVDSFTESTDQFDDMTVVVAIVRE